MGGIIKRLSRTIGKAALATCSFLLVVGLLCLLAAQGFIVWLNTKSGGNWLSSQIEVAMEGNPYKLELEGFTLAGLFGIHAGSVKVSDEEDVFFHLINVRIKINPFPIALRRLSLSIEAAQADFLKRPLTSEEQQTEKTETDITIPDIFFKQIAVGIFVDRLQIDERLLEGGLAVDFEMTQLFSLEDNTLQNKGLISLDPLAEEHPVYLPLQIHNQAALNTTNTTIQITQIEIENNDNKLRAEGFYNLTEQTFDLKAVGKLADTKAIDQNFNAPLDLDVAINGKIETFNGTASAQTTYKNIPSILSTGIERQGDNLRLTELRADAKDLSINGTAELNIATTLANADLSGNFQSLDIVNALSGQNIGGNGKFHLKAYPENGEQAASATIDLNNISYQDITAATLTADAKIPSVKNWKSANGTISVKNANVPQTTVKNATIHVTPKEDAVHFTLKADAFALNPFSVNGEASFATLEPLALNIPGLSIKAGKGSAVIKGGLSNNKPDFTLQTNNLDLASIPYTDLSSLPLTISKLDGGLTGTLAKPLINLDYALTSSLKNAPNAALAGNISYKETSISMNFSGNGEGINSLDGKISFPMSLSLKPFSFELDATNTPLSGAITGSADLASLKNFFLPEGYDLGGDLNMDMALGGVLSKPDLGGALKLRDGTFLDEFNDIQLNNLRGDAAFQQQKITITSLQAEDNRGAGRLSMQADIDLSDTANPVLNGDLVISDMQVLQSEQYNVRLNADMDLKTVAGNYFLGGVITPQEIMINIPERFNNPIPTLNIVEREEEKKRGPPLLEKIKMDMVFDAKNQIFVRGWGLDAELAGNLAVKGTAKTPSINGELYTIRGRYEELGKRFEIDHAKLRFQGAIPPSPYLDVKVSTELEEITAHILINGRAADPEPTFASTPSLPEDEVLSHILFGQDPSDISAYQAVQLAQTLRRFSGKGGGGLDLLGKVRDVTGLDDIRVEGVGTDNTTVGAGKYITDKVYLEVEQGTGENAGAASVEIELTPKVTLESKTSQSGDSDVGVFWEWNY